MGNLCFLKVCWNFFGMDVVVIIQKEYHEAVKLKKYNAFSNNNLSYGKCLYMIYSNACSDWLSTVKSEGIILPYCPRTDNGFYK